VKLTVFCKLILSFTRSHLVTAVRKQEQFVTVAHCKLQNDQYDLVVVADLFHVYFD